MDKYLIDGSEFRPMINETLKESISRVERVLNIKNPYPESILKEAFILFDFQGATSDSINMWIKKRFKNYG